MDDTAGFVEAFTTNPVPKVVFARFSSIQHLTSFVRAHKTNEKLKEKKLWASMNRSLDERRLSRTASKIKRALIEAGNFDPKAVVVDWKALRVFVVVNRKVVHVASVSKEAEPVWIEGSCAASQEVRAAVADMLLDI